jgi:hypothetical protein
MLTAEDYNALGYAALLLGEGRTAHRDVGNHNSPKRRQQPTQQRVIS